MQVVIAPDPRLRIQTKPVKKINTGLKDIIKQMFATTMAFKDPEGVGLAATQIGNTERYFVAKIDGDDLKAFINPQITWMSKRVKTYFEGCLSIPNYWGETKRAISIKVKYQDLEGKLNHETLKGTDAWFFQHEVDHLDGILFVDKVLQQKGRFFKFTGKDKAGEDTFEEITL